MSSGILNIVNCSSVAYTKGCSTYPYPQVGSSTSSTQAVPGYNPTSYGNSHFTVYSQSASTQYYASFILQEQNASEPSESIANSVIAVPVYLQECATAVDASGVRNILYHSSVADVTLNAPTNPNSSVYNIFMNMSLFDTVSNAPPGTSKSTDTTDSFTYPFFKNYTYDGTAPICDVLLTLSAQGKDMETAVFSLSSQQITANSSSKPTTQPSDITTNLGKNILTLNLPISSIFPQISTPGIIFRIKTEIIGYV